MKKYLLDTNIFIESHKQYFPFDVSPGFWQALLLHHEKKRIFSIDRVKREIDEGDDRLTRWANESAPKGFFKRTADHSVIDWYRQMVAWVSNHSHFTDAAKAEFASVADGWVVAYAKANGFVVVTLEKYNAQVRATVKIPNVCEEFGVESWTQTRCFANSVFSWCWARARNNGAIFSAAEALIGRTRIPVGKRPIPRGGVCVKRGIPGILTIQGPVASGDELPEPDELATEAIGDLKGAIKELEAVLEFLENAAKR